MPEVEDSRKLNKAITNLSRSRKQSLWRLSIGFNRDKSLETSKQ
jgi:hypothetical protein